MLPSFMKDPEASEQESLTRGVLRVGQRCDPFLVTWHPLGSRAQERMDLGLREEQTCRQEDPEGSVSLCNERAQEIPSPAVPRQPPRHTCLWGARVASE